jgi:Rad3-related DNA helicase
MTSEQAEVPQTSPPQDILSFFPLPQIRRSQEVVLREIDRVFKEGLKRIIILEAPVGSGKSAIALTLAKQSGSAHVITPRKSLQDQYYEDFSDELVTMKGRNAYPCTHESTPTFHKKVIKAIQAGKVTAPPREDSCATAPCRGVQGFQKGCETQYGTCPYSAAIQVAQESAVVVHNIHSFIFQTNFGDKFDKRAMMIVDEAHEIEGVVREFIIKKVSLKRVVPDEESPTGSNIEEWCDFFMRPEYVPEETDHDRALKETDEYFRSERDKYLERIESMRTQDSFESGGFTVRKTPMMSSTRQVVGTSFEFIPHQLGNAVSNLILNYGEKVVLMSGTIYDKDMYCRSIGVNPADAHFIRVPSAFPIANRPIYMMDKYQVDTGHASWMENFDDMIINIKRIMDIFHNVKGLIHAPSYSAATAMADALADARVVRHSPEDFQESLENFYASEEPKVFISPVCQQGVDFKEDRARFQIITRVPYMNTSDEFVQFKVQNDFNWYNYQALIVFGQQVGRVNRSERDFGATFLIDSRFNRFVSRNRSKLPKWLMDAFIYK